MNLKDFLAKEDKTLVCHTSEVLEQLDVLKSLGYCTDERLLDLIKKACQYHDYGKMNVAFQQRIKSKEKFKKGKEVAHNVLSLYFIPKSSFENIDDYYRVAYAVLYHHDYCNVLEVLREEKELISKLLAPFTVEHIYRRDIDKIYDMCTDAIAILIKGFLHKCDYSASAGVPIEYRNDFLEIGLNDLKNTWKETNENADWNDLQFFCKEHKEENIIVIAQTGMGKTEAGLHWIGNNKGFFILPLRTAINVIYNRVKDKILHNEKIEEKLALLHSDALPYYDRNSTHEMDILDYYNKSRQLSLPLNISTLDQMFDFVYKYQGYELKLVTLAYSKVVIDEIQMYSADLLAYLIYGLEKINDFGGKIAILTATLPPFIRDLLKKNIIFKEEIFIDDTKRHHVKVLNEKINIDPILRCFKTNQVNGKSNKILVVCNTVREAQKLYQQLLGEGLICVHLLHSKFIKKDRNKKEREIVDFGDTFNEDGSVHCGEGIWVSTQLVEASLDIDFDYLFTELSELNGLFQRMGRCNRKGVKSTDIPNCYIFLEVDTFILINGNKGILDPVMYDLSKTALMNLDGIITEKQKLDMINTYFTTENILDSHYMREYHKIYKYLNELYVYEVDKISAKLRNIFTRTVIPQNIFNINEIEIRRYEATLKNKNLDKMTRLRVEEKLRDYTVQIEGWVFKKIGYTTSVKLNGYNEIPVVNYKYSYEKGLVFEVDDDTMFF